MNQYAENEKLKLFKSLFKGREDVYAERWEKGKKGGYWPAYDYKPHLLWEHKRNGGTFQDFKEKRARPLTDRQFLKHFKGEQTIGIYPLLKDNTSWFIAADFDKENWEEECRTFISACIKQGIPAYLERSRSGEGGHVWIFFDRPYPAVRSRKIFITLLERIRIFSVFDRRSSFDRLFPNQDFHSGKGLGNLIALPFQREALEQGNSCFVNERMQSYHNQWKFLSSIQRVPVSHLDTIYNSLPSDRAPIPANTQSGRLLITLDNAVRLNRSGMTPGLITFLKKELNVANAEYYIRKKAGRSTWGIKQYFRFIEDTEHEVIVPRGYIGRLIRYCKQQHIEFGFQDKRAKHNPFIFSTTFTLRAHQKFAIEAASRKDFGVITGPPNSGKTVIALQIIAEKQQPVLIVVHRKQLLEQWVEIIQAFLGIPKNDIGRIGQGRAKPGELITVAMFQSLGKYLEKQETDEFARSFGTVIVDECHRIPAETF